MSDTRDTEGKTMKRVLTLRLVASLIATFSLGGCASYGWPHWAWPHLGLTHLASGWVDSDATPQWDAWPDWNEWRHWGAVYADREPPPKGLEDIPPAPGSNFAWVGGHWRWREHDGDFEWVHGRWAKPPGGAHEWVPGSWSYDQYGWYYLEGHWR